MQLFKLKAPFVSLHAILLAMVGLAVLPALIFSAILLDRYADSERERATLALDDSARGIAGAVDAQFAATATVLKTLASWPGLATYDLPAFAARLKIVTAQTGREFKLTDADGAILADTFGSEDDPASAAELHELTAAAKGRASYVTNVLRRPDGKLYVRVIVPIRQADFAGALHAIMEPDSFSDVLSSPGVPMDWIVSIVDRTATHLVRSHGSDQFAGRPLIPVLVEYIKSGRSGTLPTVSLEGIPLISAVAYAPVSGWAVAVGMPLADLQKPLKEQLQNLVLLGVALAAIALFLGWIVARYLVHATRSLRAAARRVGTGEIVEPPTTFLHEAHQLGVVLAAVSRQLRDRTRELARLNESLEQKVAARTAQLKDSHDNLVAEMKRRQDTEAQLRHMQKLEAVGQLTGGIAHDFNNMLAIVMSGLSLAQRRLARGNTDIAHLIDAALEGAEKSATLTRRLLAFSRQQPLSPEPIDANRLLVGMEGILRRTLPENIEIRTVLAGGLWRTHADVNELENAIVNLAINARDAMPDGGKLTIETANTYLDSAYAETNADAVAGLYVMIAVTDTGVGMSEAVAGKAFDPFFTTKPPGQGTGLGLSQVYGFVTQTGGHAKIHSEPGVGTAVRLYFPRFHGTDAPAAAYPARSGPATGARELVLVVEDDPAVRKLAVEMLLDLNYTALEADSAQRALKLLDANPEVRILLTDVVMPDMNGRALADEVLRRRPEVKVLFTTGYTSDAIVHNGVLDPDVQLIAKPFAIEVLAAKLAEILDQP